MVDLTKVQDKQPSTVEVDGKNYAVKTDFRYGLIFYRLMHQKAHMTKFLTLYEGETPPDLIKAWQALYSFYTARNELPRDTGGGDGVTILDYELDADLIYSAFWQCYGINLLKAELHWYEFRALLAGVRDCKLTDVFNYRTFNPNDKTKYDAQMRRMRQAWEIETSLTEEEQKELDKFERLFN